MVHLRKLSLLLPAFMTFYLLPAQTDVRAWYADGQVWVVWDITLPLPQTVGVYAKPTPFGSAGDATLIGRPFNFEYLPYALKEQVDTMATYRIPDGQGGLYQLAQNEGLFVFTPHQAGALYFAVLPWGETTVTPGDNITDDVVAFSYNPATDPVECHLQAVFPAPFATGYACLAYTMWADGRQDHWDNRPDFPIMANAAKNGMPGFFLLSVPVDLDTTQPFPLSVWLHGGGGTARQSIAGMRPIVDIDPQIGVLLAHNDDCFGIRDQTPPHPDNVTWHFGWRKNYDPFTNGNLPVAEDTIINYTQRRYLWIDQWLQRQFNIDPNRININGHSMGSAGATALAKGYPRHYASSTIFNNSFGGPEPVGNINVIFGNSNDNFPTNLVDRQGQTVRLAQLFNLTDNISPERDLPLLRSYHGKNDDNGTMHWGPNVIEQYKAADSLALGAHLFWSERAHGIDTGPDLNDHWAFGNAPTQQTVYDNVDYEESHFNAGVSYPAFFNHRLDPAANDPGDGTIGTGINGTGDDWGTWGGWHRWDWNDIDDEPGGWAVTAWLEGTAIFSNDNCPHNQLSANMAIRKPVEFKPTTGLLLFWTVRDMASNAILQDGAVTVQADGLVVLPPITVYRENIRKVRIYVSMAGSTETNTNQQYRISLAPNPSAGPASLTINAAGDHPIQVMATAPDGRRTAFAAALHEGTNKISLAPFAGLPAGVYTVSVAGMPGRHAVRWVKMPG